MQDPLTQLQVNLKFIPDTTPPIESDVLTKGHCSRYGNPGGSKAHTLLTHDSFITKREFSIHWRGHTLTSDLEYATPAP